MPFSILLFSLVKDKMCSSSKYPHPSHGRSFKTNWNISQRSGGCGSNQKFPRGGYWSNTIYSIPADSSKMQLGVLPHCTFLDGICHNWKEFVRLYQNCTSVYLIGRLTKHPRTCQVNINSSWSLSWTLTSSADIGAYNPSNIFARARLV